MHLATGEVTTLVGSVAGSAEGVGSSALLRSPAGLAVDPSQQKLYVADTGNMLLRVVTIATRRMVTLAGIASNIA